MNRLFLASLALIVFMSGEALADAELAKSKNCMACHAVDKKTVGPAFKDVAAKYAGQKDAEEKLAQKVMQGGGGVWGAMAMPPNAAVNAQEAHALVKWVLSQK